MIFNKVIWLFKRHPFLYISRFKLLSKNSNVEDIDKQLYNKINHKEDTPTHFKEVNLSIFRDVDLTTDLDRVKHLNLWLYNNVKGGPGLSEPSGKALKIMLAGKGGVCSDMAQIFNNFCVINDIKVREWGTTRAPFDKAYGGHSFNEVFSKELNKWMLIDVSSCLMFYKADDVPISVIELYQLIRTKQSISFKSFHEQFQPKKVTIEKNYLNPQTVPFLICNYSNKTYDTFLKLRPYLPVFMIHFILYLLNKSYHYKFPLDDYRNIFA